MTEQDRLLARIAGHLDEAGIPYLICGSVASGFFGEPRATIDIDMLIDADEPRLRRFLAMLGDAFYASPEAALDALARRSMFNIIELDTGLKVDLVFLKDEPFHREEFRRRRPIAYLGREYRVQTPEDIILSKLAWSRESLSEKQWRDALGVALQCRDHLDFGYLRRWAVELDVSVRLEELLAEAERIATG